MVNKKSVLYTFLTKMSELKGNLSIHLCRLFRYEMLQRNRAYNRLTGKVLVLTRSGFIKMVI
jgi:hypothetical protein